MLFDTIFKDEDVRVARERIVKAIRKVRDSGKLVDAGVFADARGAYIVAEIDSPEEMRELLSELLDRFHVESHPVISLEKLEDYFKKHPIW